MTAAVSGTANASAGGPIPHAPATDKELLAWLGAQVQESADRIFDTAGPAVTVHSMSLTAPFNRKEDRHHRVLTVRYWRGGEALEKRIWLKFVNWVRSRYEVHTATWDRTHAVSDFFPRPYFFGEWDGKGMIAMEAVDGASLRNLFLRRAVTRRVGALGPVFAALGRGLRAFHDSSEPAGFASIGEIEQASRRVAAESAHLAPEERRRAEERIAAAAARAGGARTRLPLIPIHHDCSLRNVIVRYDRSPCLVDLDSVRAPSKSRWYDVAGFLINLESQVKYTPLADTGSIAAGWRSFWDGYSAPGMPDGLAPEQVGAVLFLMKVQFLLGVQRRPLFEVYTRALTSRYLARLTKSLLRGEHLIGA